MNSERRKREEEIARAMRELGTSREADAAFQEQMRKAAAAIIEKETSRIQQTEAAPEAPTGPFKAKRRSSAARAGRKITITPKGAAVGLLIAGAGLSLVMPGVGAALLLGAVALFVWAATTAAAKK